MLNPAFHDKKISPRSVLQYVGTNLFRDNFHPAIWCFSLIIKINNILKNINSDMLANTKVVFIVPDVRFINEILILDDYFSKQPKTFVHKYLILSNRNEPDKNTFYTIDDHFHTTIDSSNDTDSAELIQKLLNIDETINKNVSEHPSETGPVLIGMAHRFLNVKPLWNNKTLDEFYKMLSDTPDLITL